MNYDNDFYARNLKFQTALARVLVPWLVENLEFSSIADFGCGCGYFLKWLASTAGITDFIGLNADFPQNLCIPSEKFMVADFTKKTPLSRTYDLVISLEVAEHLPELSADFFIKKLTTYAEKYILFSAATPGQKGVGHLNEQPHEYWHEKFKARGWNHKDVIRPVLKGHKSVPFWYRRNIFLYER